MGLYQLIRMGAGKNEQSNQNQGCVKQIRVCTGRSTVS